MIVGSAINNEQLIINNYSVNSGMIDFICDNMNISYSVLDN